MNRNALEAIPSRLPLPLLLECVSTTERVQRYFGNERRERHRGRLESSNMETILDSASGSGNRCDYIHDTHNITCKRSNTLIIEEYSNSGALRYAVSMFWT